MLIRDFGSPVETVDDIKNITEKRRTIFLFKYTGGPHKALNAVFNGPDNYCDVYLINDSVVHGTGFGIPNGIVLYNRNAYRGAAISPITPENKLNLNSEIRFYNGSYTNRVHRTDGDIFRLTTPMVCRGGGPGGSSIEDELMVSLKTNIVQPYPQFYNVEDMMVFESKHMKEFCGDFLYDYSDCPFYKLGSLIDQYTKVAVVEIPTFNQLIKPCLANGFLADSFADPDEVDPTVRYANGTLVNVETFKSNLVMAYLKINEAMMETAFSSFDVVIDTETGEFNVPIGSLKTKFREINKTDLTKEYALLLMRIGETVDVLFGEEDIPDESFLTDMCPNRITMHISNDSVKIRVSNTRKLIKSGKTLTPLYANDLVSMSDTDETIQLYESDQSYS